MKRICALLEENDFVPDLRVERFSAIPPDFILVGWQLTVEGVEVGEDGTFVQVCSGPLLRKLGEAMIGVFTYYRELYRIVDGKLRFIEGAPMPDDMTISICVM